MKSKKLCISRKMWINDVNDEINKIKIELNKNWKDWKNEKLKKKWNDYKSIFIKTKYYKEINQLMND
jgi:hypothetical protein